MQSGNKPLPGPRLSQFLVTFRRCHNELNQIIPAELVNALLLVSWFLASLGHQKPLYWLCKMQDEQIFPFHYEEFQLPVLSLCWEMIAKTNIFFIFLYINSTHGVNTLWPSDNKWWHKSGYTLSQVVACCLMAPSHYLNQCCLIISKIQCCSSKSNFTKYSTINH